MLIHLFISKLGVGESNAIVTMIVQVVILEGMR